MRSEGIGSILTTMTQSLEELVKEEAELAFPSFNEDDAWSLGTLLAERARTEGLSITIDISTKDKVLFHYTCPGTTPDNDQWVIRKRNLVNRFGHSSWYFAQKLKQDGSTLEGRYYVSEKDYAAHGGCFPINVQRTGLIGTVTVSGLPQAEDHAFVVRAIRDYLAGVRRPESVLKEAKK